MNIELAAKFINPKLVIDCGARLGDWAKEAKQVWPDAVFILIEGNDECLPSLLECGVARVISIALLSDSEKEVDFYRMKDCPMATGCSYYRENTFYFNDENASVTKMKTTTLDATVKDIQIEAHALLKIDCQGAELDILKGAEETLKHCDSVICEVAHQEYNAGAPLEPSVTAFLEQHGFKKKECVGTTILPQHGGHVQSDYLYARS